MYNFYLPITSRHITCFQARCPWRFNPQERLASYFSLQYHHWITQCHENKGNDQQLKKLLVVRQILIVSTLVTVQRTVWRIGIMMLGCKGLVMLLTFLLNMIMCKQYAEESCALHCHRLHHWAIDYLISLIWKLFLLWV